jgi:BirA family transcriptional regulator, biotin operon repressor / biotin---[acetyl-CoA-carboxylase] ligase
MSNIFVNRQLISLPEEASTNNYAANLPPSTPEGSVVWALSQTQGRGLGSNSWESEPHKNLTFSIILKPVFSKAVGQFYISKVISLAVSDFIAMYTDRVAVKWPNDIYVGNKKIAGILIENSIERDFIKQSIVGIGINMNQKVFTSEAPNPVSLAQLTGEEYDLEESLEVLSVLIEYRYGLLKDGDFATIDENYIDLLYRYQQLSSYQSNGKTFKGTITGVKPTGELQITDETGRLQYFLYKEVEFVQEALL